MLVVSYPSFLQYPDIIIYTIICVVLYLRMSILRYPGGKTRAIKVLDQQLPDMSDVDYVVSPFFGWGSFEFHIKDKYRKPPLVAKYLP